jgi:hypothetical protein
MNSSNLGYHGRFDSVPPNLIGVVFVPTFPYMSLTPGLFEILDVNEFLVECTSDDID